MVTGDSQEEIIIIYISPSSFINLVKDVTMYVDKSRLTGVHELRHALSAPLFVVFSFPIKDDQIDFLLSIRGVCLTRTWCKLSSHLCSTLSFYSCSLSVNLIIFISKLPKLRCDHIINYMTFIIRNTNFD